MDLEQVTTFCRVAVCVGPGGAIDRSDQAHLLSKVLAGNNSGSVSLIDSSKKNVLDRFEIPEFKNRRILAISTCSVEWVSTQLTYVAVVARGSPVVVVLLFKHHDNKIRQLYTVNVCPDMPNPEAPEQNLNQSYKELPSSVVFSQECAFLAVTLYGGEVHLLKMPAILNPLKEDTAAPQADEPAAKDEKASPTKKGAKAEPKE